MLFSDILALTDNLWDIVALRVAEEAKINHKRGPFKAREVISSMGGFWGILLEPFVKAFERLDGSGLGKAHELRMLFATIARNRPDLVERSLFAERGHNSVEIEKILKLALAEIEFMKSNGAISFETEVPPLGSFRFNHSTGLLHLGHSDHSTFIFPNGELKDQPISN